MIKRILYLMIYAFCTIIIQASDLRMPRPVTYTNGTYDDGILSARMVNNNAYEAYRIEPRITSNQIYYYLAALDPNESVRTYNALSKQFAQQLQDVQENSDNKTPDEVEE